ncbi:MAG: cytochrome c3 family protein [Sandaracinaceae bacterium]
MAAVAIAASPILSSCRGHGDANRMEIATDSDCVVCHQPEYDATSAPPHPGLFTTRCRDCHSEDAWIPATPINHEWFVLANRHAELSCTECHAVGFGPDQTPSQCEGCHRPEYDAAMMPPHAGYPTDCASCHTDAGWRPSTFVHSFTLDGAHALISCATCHTGEPPRYMGLPTDCVGCHRADYDMSPYPSHQTFPTTCMDCHTTTAWTPALEGAHPNDRFRISGGSHGGYECTQCHNASLGPSTMGMNCDCVGCHEGEHTRARMDGKHREVRGYPAGDAAPSFCLDCHPDGRN